MFEKISSRKIGYLVVSVSVLLGAVFLIFVNEMESSQDQACQVQCQHDDGIVCPMEDSALEKAAFYTISSSIIVLGFIGGYMSFSTEDKLVLGEESRFETVLSILSEDERSVLEAVSEQEGIKQSTLKYRVDFSKSKLSKILKDLEEVRDLITREKSGKTNKVYLKRSFD